MRRICPRSRARDHLPWVSELVAQKTSLRMGCMKDLQVFRLDGNGVELTESLCDGKDHFLISDPHVTELLLEFFSRHPPIRRLSDM